MSVRQYVVSDPPTIKYSQTLKDTIGSPMVVWQQQKEISCIRTYKIVYNGCPDRFYEIGYTRDFETQFCCLPLVKDHNPQYTDPEYGQKPYRDDEIYDKQNLQFKRDDYPPTDDKDYPKLE